MMKSNLEQDNITQPRPKIWIDGDSCVKLVREYLIKKSESRGFDLWLVSDRLLPFTPKTNSIHFVQVNQEPDAADSYILSGVHVSDLVITRDIPLAKKLVDQGIIVMNDRGIIHTSETIDARLRERNTKQELRELGLLPKETDRYGDKEFRQFCQSFDRVITKLKANLVTDM
jgi:uncharacterized protein YaiI (UPF0178 family)